MCGIYSQNSSAGCILESMEVVDISLLSPSPGLCSVVRGATAGVELA